ncbi:hypothetical protein CSA37_08685 [Candidatus Fermentibacteria bacterium]|nr:MAG: hypothetical protein CSA37_08685 [Candidatus Fermentibacteria bacterium]
MKTSVIILMIAAIAVMAETVTVNPSADTYTIPAGGNFGSQNKIQCANKPAAGHPDERMMFLFDLSAYAGRTVESAVLNLEVFFQCGSGSGTNTQFFAATQSWDESWSGAHVSIESSPSGTYHFSGIKWHQIDVTDLVQRWVDGEIDNYGIVFKVLGTYPWTKCYSRETTHSPFLELTMSGNALSSNTWAGIKSTWMVD